MSVSPLLIGGVTCVCAFFALVLAGGIGFLLMRKKGGDADKAPADEAPSSTDPTEDEAGGAEPAVASGATSEEDKTEESNALHEPAEPAKPAEPPAPESISESVPDPSSIQGLDPTPIIASDTLDEDEADSPTVIIHRGTDRKGDD